MVYMPKNLSTIYKDFYKKVVDSTTDIIPNLQSTKSLAPPHYRTTDFEYNKLGREEEWKANFIQELINRRHGGLKVPGMK